MTRGGTRRDDYTGRAGQHAVLGELLLREINAAVPEIDEGEDVLAFVVGERDTLRIQVKTANAEALKEEGRYAARVSVPLGQLRQKVDLTFFYIFAIRFDSRWSDFIILSHRELRQQQERGVGYLNRSAGELQLYLSFSPEMVRCSGQDWQPYRNAWEALR